MKAKINLLSYCKRIEKKINIIFIYKIDKNSNKSNFFTLIKVPCQTLLVGNLCHADVVRCTEKPVLLGQQQIFVGISAIKFFISQKICS